MGTWFTGVWPAMVTPMDADGGVCLSSLAPLVEKFVAEGAGGIYLLGSTGQGPIQTVDERKAVAAETVRAAAGRIPVMVHVGAIRVDDSVELAAQAAEVGADVISSVVPMYYPPTLAGAMEHYRRIAGASDLPFYAYNFTIPNCTVEAYAEALLSIPNCVGLKFTNRDAFELALLKVASDGRLNVLSGADDCFLAAAAQGADGCIGSTQNVAVPEFRLVIEAAEAGRYLAARDGMIQIARLVRDLTIRRGLSGLHHVLSQEGIPCGQPRHPILRQDAAGLEAAMVAYLECRAAIRSAVGG